MGELQQPTNSRRVRINGYTVVGRAPMCHLILEDPAVSKQHTEIWWHDGSWRARDLNSRNGTFVNGNRLQAGETAQLGRGTRLGFGHADCDWELSNVGPPVPIAVRQRDGTEVLGADGMLPLPSETDPQFTVHLRAEGWCVEHDGEVTPLAPGETLRLDEEAWTIELPLDLPGTTEIGSQPTVADITLEFQVTPNERIVELTLVHRGVRRVFEPRAHQYLVLTLAREALQDAENGLDEGARGWVDGPDLARRLGMDEGLLNVHVFRSRRELANAGVANATALIERHGRSGQLRLGPVAVSVHVRTPPGT